MNTKLIKRFYCEKSIFSNKFDFASYMFLEINKSDLCQTSTPVFAGIRITDSCNLSCPHCFVHSNQHSNMNLKDFMSIVDILSENKLIKLTITGGEPFVHPDIINIIDYAKSKIDFITLQTNGTIISDDTVKNLSGIFSENDFIQISLDGFDNESLLKTRGYAEFSRIESNILKLRKNGINVKINVVVTNANVSFLDSIFQKAMNLDVQEIQFSPLFGNHDKAKKIFLPKDSDILESFSKILELYYDETTDIKITVDPISVPWGNDILKSLNIELGEFFCPAHSVSCEVDVNGDVYPCPFLFASNFKLGNILHDPLDKIWHNSYANLYDKFEIDSIDLCKECDEEMKCKRGCFAMAIESKTALDSRCSKYINKMEVFHSEN